MKSDELDQKLTDAGKNLSPAFSSDLHARIMAEVRHSGAGDSPAKLKWVWTIGLAAAAIAALIIVPWAMLPKVPPAIAPTSPSLLSMSDMPSLHEIVHDTVVPMREKLNEARFAYLDRDGKRLALFLWHSLPGAPADHSKSSSPL
ncbi:MAG TPA: hypothetical protein VFE58_04295 [Tepidisphaeraceae bacterium]|jgi:hypothetical protein|nr:hypothetical protein [Tepidisphaeraceae bacterium]